MASNRDTTRTAPPSLTDLFAGYLSRQASAPASADSAGEVEPFEVVTGPRLEPQQAWDGAVVVLSHYQPEAPKVVPPAATEWTSLVSADESFAAVPFCLGNFPQLVRDLQPLVRAATLGSLRPTSAAPKAVPALERWAEQCVRQNLYPHSLLAVALLRRAGQFDRAAALLDEQCGQVPTEWQDAWDNEEAALLWHSGHADEAAQRWRRQPAVAPVLFNRGTAALFLDRPAEARKPLTEAVALIPESSPWHHLGRLYLALAELRG
jgi:tetratricopeptide (TPR) repeat protein